jgi:hypothetical protein
VALVDLVEVAGHAKLIDHQPASVQMLHLVGAEGAVLELVLELQHHLQRDVEAQVRP